MKVTSQRLTLNNENVRRYALKVSKDVKKLKISNLVSSLKFLK